MSDSGRQIGNCRHARTPEACVECLRARLRAMEAALRGLVEAVVIDSNDPAKGISGYTGARLSDARAALGAGPGGGT